MLLDGDARAKPRSPQTIYRYFGAARPILKDPAGQPDHLREVTAANVLAVSFEMLKISKRCSDRSVPDPQPARFDHRQILGRHGPVSEPYIREWLDKNGFTVDRIRADRILHEGLTAAWPGGATVVPPVA